MRRSILLLLPITIFVGCGASPRYVPRNGDIIFHTSRSSQSVAVQRATGSRYSHMGVVYVEKSAPFVYEAVGPVKLTPLDDWVKGGEGGHYVVKRLRDADRRLTPMRLAMLKAEGRKFQGRAYDLYFEWSDDRIYCSELVWKMYKRALGIEVGRTQRLGDFQLSDPAVKAKIKEKWPGGPPMSETVVSPAAIFESGQLVTVPAR